jgi:hypothetical protein
VSALTKEGQGFFLYFPWFILLLVIVCFSGKAIFDHENLPPLTLIHHFHALAMGSWFLLFAAQPTLIHFGKTALHRRLGRLSPLLVVTFIGLAIPMSLINWNRIGQPLIFTANGVNLILFVSLYITSICYRTQVAIHKRLMLYATITLLGPAVGRLAEIFALDHVASAPVLLAIQLCPIIRDKIADHRVHPATWIGFVVVFSSIPLILGLTASEDWHTLLESWLGAPNISTRH